MIFMYAYFYFYPSLDSRYKNKKSKEHFNVKSFQCLHHMTYNTCSILSAHHIHTFGITSNLSVYDITRLQYVFIHEVIYKVLRCQIAFPALYYECFLA